MAWIWTEAATEMTDCAKRHLLCELFSGQELSIRLWLHLQVDIPDSCDVRHRGRLHDSRCTAHPPRGGCFTKTYLATEAVHQ